MPRSLAAAVVVALLLVKAGPTPGRTDEQLATEKQKIEALLKHVEDMKETKFVRNSKEYDAKTAAAFLRGKWEANDSEIKTAKDFIEKVASVSSTTRKPYLIRLRDGKEIKSGDYLLEELKKLEKPPNVKSLR